MNHEELQRRLDLLADGELAAQEQRDLFELLDRTPGGWRRCALTLLEVRCWQEGLRHWGPELPGAQESPPAEPARPIPPAQGLHRLEHLAWATVAVALLAVGMVVGRWFPSVPGPSTPREQAALVAEHQPAPAEASGGNMAASPVADLGGPVPREPSRPGPVVSQTEQQQPWAAFWGWRDVTPEGRAIHRLLAAPPATALDGPALRPEDVFPRQWLQALQALGHHIQVRRYWEVVSASDGTKVLVPRYEIHVNPARSPGIQ